MNLERIHEISKRLSTLFAGDELSVIERSQSRAAADDLATAIAGLDAVCFLVEAIAEDGFRTPVGYATDEAHARAAAEACNAYHRTRPPVVDHAKATLALLQESSARLERWASAHPGGPTCWMASAYQAIRIVPLPLVRCQPLAA